MNRTQALLEKLLQERDEVPLAVALCVDTLRQCSTWQDRVECINRVTAGQFEGCSARTVLAVILAHDIDSVAEDIGADKDALTAYIRALSDFLDEGQDGAVYVAELLVGLFSATGVKPDVLVPDSGMEEVDDAYSRAIIDLMQRQSLDENGKNQDLKCEEGMEEEASYSSAADSDIEGQSGEIRSKGRTETHPDLADGASRETFRYSADPFKEDPLVDQELPDELQSNPFHEAHLLGFYSGHYSSLLDGFSVVCVLHFLRDLVPFAHAMVRCGARHENIHCFCKTYPYPQRRAVAKYLVAEGFQVPSLETDLHRVLENLNATGTQRLAIVDDGGHVVPLLLKDQATYANLREATSVAVEQTTRGWRNIQKVFEGSEALNEDTLKERCGFPILGVAASHIKGEKEPPYIAQDVAHLLSTWAPDLKLHGRKALVIGAGAIGASVANKLHKSDVEVIVYDRALSRKQKVPGIQFVDGTTYGSVLNQVDYVIGTTGERSLTVNDLYRLKNGAFLASASSEQKEFPIEELARRAKWQDYILPSTGRRAGTRFVLSGRDDKQLIMLADGYPVNFWGEDSMTPALGDWIMSILFLVACGGLQRAPELEIKNGVNPPNLVDEIVKRSGVEEEFARMWP